MFELREYLTVNGRSPFGEWLSSLKEPKIRARIRVRLDRVSLGHFGDCKRLGGGIQELRLDIGPGYRIYFGQEGNRIIMLLCGGDKSTQRTDIIRARAFWADYNRR